jgi:hypothetical protein
MPISKVATGSSCGRLKAAREPQGMAMSALRLSSCRKLRPGSLEEFIFYDHPSGHDRVHRAMVWLKENPGAAQSPSALPGP